MASTEPLSGSRPPARPARPSARRSAPRPSDLTAVATQARLKKRAPRGACFAVLVHGRFRGARDRRHADHARTDPGSPKIADVAFAGWVLELGVEHAE